MKLSLLILIISLFSFAACKTSQGARKGKLKKRSAEYVQKAMIQNQFKADWLSGKAKIKYNDGKQSMTVFSNIRIQKDSAIWMNVKVFGIEAVRVLINPDSIFVLERLGKRYMARDIWWLQDEFGLPVNFSGLQSLLLGNPVFFQSEFEIEKDSVQYILKGENEKYNTNYKVDGLTYKLVELLLARPTVKQVANFEFSDYKALEDKQLFSHSRYINVNSPETGNINVQIDFTKVDIGEEVSMPFSVPERYSRE